MDSENAAKIIERLVDDAWAYGNKYTMDGIEALHMACEALKRDIPRDVEIKTSNVMIGDDLHRLKIRICPSCKGEVVKFNGEYICINSNCRQKIKGGKKNEI